MRWWSRGSAPQAATLPAPLPRLDGTGWWAPAQLGRPTFASRTLHETGLRHAYDPEVPARAELLVAAALGRRSLPVEEQDAKHLRGVLLAAALAGLGIGTAERSRAPAPDGQVDVVVAAALEQARDALPQMRTDAAALAAWLLLAGRHLSVAGEAVLPRLLATLDGP